MSYVDRESIDNFKPLLADYLMNKHGLNINKPFTCINPEHEDHHPSMSYSYKYNICKCFSCGASYDIFDLIGMDYNVESFKDKLEIVDQLYPNISNIEFKKFDVIESSNNVIDFTNYFERCIKNLGETDYLMKRKINPELYKKYNVGYDNKKDMVVFPINKNCYFARGVSNNNKIKSKGTSYLWNEELLENSNKKTLIYVTESIIDSLSLETIDKDVNIVALNGLPNYKRLLKVVEDKNFIGNLVLAFDNDKSGLMYQEIVKKELSKLNVNSFSVTLISNTDFKDLNEVLINDSEKLKSNYEYFNDSFTNVINRRLEIKGEDLEL